MADNAGNGKKGGAAEQPAKPKAKPRDYIVCREETLATVGELGTDESTRVLVVLGPTSQTTPKAARIAVAKERVPESELKDGIELNAVPAKALASGRKTVKLETQPKWDA